MYITNVRRADSRNKHKVPYQYCYSQGGKGGGACVLVLADRTTAFDRLRRGVGVVGIVQLLYKHILRQAQVR